VNARGGRRQLATLLEIMAVFIGGLLAGRAVVQWLGLHSLRESITSRPSNALPDLLHLAGEVTAGYAVRYGILLTIAFASGFWLARYRLRDYGVTSGGRLREHVQNGIAAAALTAIPGELIQLASAHSSSRPDIWRLIDRVPWDWKFWLYMAASSYVVVPILEELTFRGWMQTRLASAFGTASAIVLTSIVFAVSHTQYLGANALAIALLLGTLFGAVVLGVLRDMSGSIVPAIVAHALLNVPTRAAGSVAVIVLSAVIVVICRKRVMGLLSGVVETIRGARWLDLAWGAAVIVVIAAIVLAFRAYAIVVALVAAAISLLLYNAPPHRSGG